MSIESVKSFHYQPHLLNNKSHPQSLFFIVLNVPLFQDFILFQLFY